MGRTYDHVLICAAWAGGTLPHLVTIVRTGDWSGLALHGLGVMCGLIVLEASVRAGPR